MLSRLTDFFSKPIMVASIRHPEMSAIDMVNDPLAFDVENLRILPASSLIITDAPASVSSVSRSITVPVTLICAMADMLHIVRKIDNNSIGRAATDVGL